MHTSSFMRLGFRAGMMTLLTAGTVSCNFIGNSARVTNSESSSIRLQLDRYRTAVMAMDYDAIASVFATNASLSHEQQTPITTRDSIRKFLMSFSAYHVMAYELVADSQTVTGANARAAGHYAQTVRIPDGSTVSVTGLFSTEWRREADGIWRIIVLHTASLPHA